MRRANSRRLWAWSAARYASNRQKKRAELIPLARVRGPTPRKKPPSPLERYTCSAERATVGCFAAVTIMRVFTTSKGVVAAAAAVQVDLARRSQNGQVLGAARVARVVPQLRQVGATQRPVEGACFGGDRQVVDLGSPSRRRPKVLLEVVDRLVRLDRKSVV